VDLFGGAEEQVLEHPRCPSSFMVEEVFEVAADTKIFEFQACK